MALTAGFLCIAACDAAGRDSMPADVMTRISVEPAIARYDVCRALPWGNGTDFTKATSKQQLGKMAGQLIVKPLCACPPIVPP